MATCVKIILGFLVVTAVSAKLAVLVTGMPNSGAKSLQAEPKPAKKVSAPAQFATDKPHVSPYESVEKKGAAGTQAAYNQLLGIDPLTNSLLNEMYYLYDESDNHLVKKRVLHMSEEELAINEAYIASLHEHGAKDR